MLKEILLSTDSGGCSRFGFCLMLVCGVVSCCLWFVYVLLCVVQQCTGVFCFLLGSVAVVLLGLCPDG